MNCINRTLKEFTDLQEATGIHPDILAAKIATFQQKNNTELFPTLIQLAEYEIISKHERAIAETDKLSNELNNKIDNSSLTKSVETAYSLISKQIKRYLDNKGEWNKLIEIFKPDEHGDRLVSLQEVLRTAKNTLNELEKEKFQVRAMSNTVITFNFLLDKIELSLKEILSNQESAKDNISTTYTYLKLSQEWKTYLESIKPIFEIGNPKFRQEINNALGKIKTIETNILENDKIGLTQVLQPYLVKPGKEFIEFANKEIKLLEKQVGRLQGVEKQAKLQEIKDYENLIKRVDFENTQNILDFLTGKAGDTNRFSRFLESYRDSPSPIISSFATWLKDNIQQVSYEAQQELIEYEQKIAEIDKKLPQRWNPYAVGEKLTFADKRVDKDGNISYVQSFLTPWKDVDAAKQELENKVNSLKEQLEEETNEDNIKELESSLKSAQKELNEHLSLYWHRPYTNEYYEKNKLWQDKIGQALKEKSDAIWQQIEFIQNEATNLGVELTDEQESQIEALRLDYYFLGSVYNQDGTPKDEEEVKIAKRLQEIRVLNRELNEYIPNIPKFERKRNTYSEFIISTKNLTKDSEEYRKLMQEWDVANTKTQYEESYYNRISDIFTEIELILSKINPSISKKVKELRKDKNDLLYGHRDDSNQPIGTDLTDLSSDKIKTIDEQIEKFLSLSRANEDYSKLSDREKKKLFGDPQAGKKGLFEELSELQQSVPTEYYIKAFNDISNKYGVLIDDSGNIKGISLTESSEFERLLTKKDFKDWFERNHYQKEVWDSSTKSRVKKWFRTSQWNRTIPTDEKYYKTTTLEDGTIIKGVPSNKYSFIKVKDKYKTPKIIGETIDNKGQWLPKTVEQGAPEDSPFINEKYYSLFNRTDEEALNLQKLYKIHLDMHFKSQENLDYKNKLGYVLPSVPKEAEENLRDFIQDLKTPSRIKDKFKVWYNRKFGYDASEGNYTEQETLLHKLGTKLGIFSPVEGVEKEAVVGNLEKNFIPIKYTTPSEAITTSLNLGRSISKEFYASKLHQKLQSLYPIAQSIERVSETEDIKKMAKDASSKESNLTLALKHLIGREFEGKIKAYEVGKTGDAILRALQTVGYWAFIPLNYKVSFSNVVQGITQIIINAGNGHFTEKDYAKSTATYTKVLKDLIYTDYFKNELGSRSYWGQMLLKDNPIQGATFEQNVGERFSQSPLKDFLSLRWIINSRDAGEFHIQARLWVTMLEKTKVMQNDVEIPLSEAYELNEKGIIQLKEGIDKDWDFGGKKREEFKNLVQSLNRSLNGTFETYDKSQLNYYSLGQTAMFLKSWFVSPAINRFGASNVKADYKNIKKLAVGIPSTLLIGFGTAQVAPFLAVPLAAATFFSTAITIKSSPRFNINKGKHWGFYMRYLNAVSKIWESGLQSWEVLSDEEKQGLYMLSKELGIILAADLILQIVFGLGGDDDEKEKKWKEILENSSYTQKFLLYQLIRLEVETSTFMSPKQYTGLIFDFSIKRAVEQWYEFLQTFLTQEEYDRDYGAAKKGEKKYPYKLKKALGLQGISEITSEEEMDKAIKGYYNMVKNR